MPYVALIIEHHFDMTGSLSGSVLFETYHDVYYPHKKEYMAKEHNLGPRNNELFKQHEKLFNQLKRRFQMKKGEIPKAIKDLDWVRSVEKRG
jgi:hypothetical protein